MIRDYSCIALVDFSYLFKRNYHGAGVNAPPNAGAERTLRDLEQIRDDVDHVIVCLDTAPYFRRDKFPGYKAQRETPPAEELNQKRAVVAELKRRGFTIARARGFEADDIIATLARAYGEWATEVRMIGPDKDIAQCITKNVIQYVPSSGTRDAERRDHLKCKVKYGVYPTQMPLWQAMVGDDGDNLEGVRGIGDKKATFVVNTIVGVGKAATLQGLAEYMAEKKPTAREFKLIADQWESLRNTLELVTLDAHAPIDVEALLTKLTPELDPDTEVGVEGFEPNTTPQGSTPPDALELAPEELEAERAVFAEPEPKGPRVGTDPNAAAFLQEQAQERARTVAAANTNAPKTPERVAATQATIAAGNAAEQTRGRPAVTEAEFDPISRAPGATGTLPPLPPKPEPQPAAAAAPAPAKPQPAATTALAKAPEHWGVVTAKLQPTDLQSAWTLAKWLCASELYTKKFTTAQQAFAVIHRGVELGLDVGAALGAFHNISGTPTMSADLIRSLAKRHPDCEYFYCESSDDTQATWVTRNRRHPEGVVQRLQYTIEEARQDPSLWKKDRYGGPSMWEKRPKQMLSKTCSSVLARQEYEGSLLGFYCPEELSNGIIDTVGEVAA